MLDVAAVAFSESAACLLGKLEIVVGVGRRSSAFRPAYPFRAFGLVMLVSQAMQGFVCQHFESGCPCASPEA